LVEAHRPAHADVAEVVETVETTETGKLLLALQACAVINQ
jgi:hypothetical protein